MHKSKKVTIVFGARQVGKTTLVRKLLKKLSPKALAINADEERSVSILSSRNLKTLRSLVEGYDLLFLDEAQRIPNICVNLKLLIDNVPNLKIITTGSASFTLANKISEPLTGRRWTYTLFPISYGELMRTNNAFELVSQLEERLVYGSYPNIFSLGNNDDKKKYLEELSIDYLYKDILALETIKNARKIRDLLKLIAFQVGSEVSLTELGSILDMSKEMVSRYIDLLEKSFVLFRLSGFSRNLRKEVSKMDKIYFYDLGIRNSIIDNMKPLADRNDRGQLWENFLMIERLKILSSSQQQATRYYWRTYTGAKLDYVEEREGNLYGFEFKYKSRKSKAPATWTQTYRGTYKEIHSDNFLDFIT